MTLLLDAGAFIAVERGDRSVMALLAREHRSAECRSHMLRWSGRCGAATRARRVSHVCCRLAPSLRSTNRSVAPPES